MTQTTIPEISVKEVTIENDPLALLSAALTEPSASKKGFKFESFFETFMNSQESFRFVFKTLVRKLAKLIVFIGTKIMTISGINSLMCALSARIGKTISLPLKWTT